MTGDIVNKINVELTEEEATAFVLFRQHQDLFLLLLKEGVFDVRNGKVVLHFNNDQLSMIEKEFVSWRRIR